MLIEYPVLCQNAACGRAANFKVASQWSDGTTHELKTYFLACEACLPRLLKLARERHKACPRTAGETLGKPGVFQRNNPRNSLDLSRRPDLETA